MVHKLKTHTDAFEAVWQGRKTAEFRKDDRLGEYQQEDTLVLMETDALTNRHSGRWMECAVTDVRRGPSYGIPEGYAMLSIRVEMRADERSRVRSSASDFTV